MPQFLKQDEAVQARAAGAEKASRIKWNPEPSCKGCCGSSAIIASFQRT